MENSRFFRIATLTLPLHVPAMNCEYFHNFKFPGRWFWLLVNLTQKKSILVIEVVVVFGHLYKCSTRPTSEENLVVQLQHQLLLWIRSICWYVF